MLMVVIWRRRSLDPKLLDRQRPLGWWIIAIFSMD
jgi:hypothetical protein